MRESGRLTAREPARSRVLCHAPERARDLPRAV